MIIKKASPLERLELLHILEKSILSTFKTNQNPNPVALGDFLDTLNAYGIRCVSSSIFWNDPTLVNIFNVEKTIVGIETQQINQVSSKLEHKYGEPIYLLDIFEQTSSLPVWLKPPNEVIEQDKFKFICNVYNNETGKNIDSEYLSDLIFEFYGIDKTKGNVYYYPSYFGDKVFFDAIFAFEEAPGGWEMLWAERICTLFVNALHLSCRIYINYLLALRSTIAKIMGRVNAHDMGHVLENVELPLTDDEYDPQLAVDFFKHLKSYLRTRMVFANIVASSDPSWGMHVPLISQIILPFVKFKSSKVICDSPVMTNIAKSEDVEKIELKVYKETIKNQIDFYQKNFEEFLVQVPAGIVGVHALYCILENIIRNSAKYGKNKSNEFVVHLLVEEYDDRFLRIKIWDNYSTYTKAGFEKSATFSHKMIITLN